MKLVGSKTSPYVRKIRVLLAEKKLAFEFVEESAWNAGTTVPRYNPLNKVPALVLDDGESVYDSAVITEYLDALGPAHLLPADPAARARARRDEALGDGIADAGVAIFLERKREAARQDPAWLARQRDKVDAGIAAWSKAVASRPAGAPLTLGDIACGCALFWLEFRLPEVRWRDDPALARWAQALEARPSFATTKPG
ncbi:MAG TPA: glutathione S-transferase N-terminal domain-containing protein [Usitatibacter sp.]|nr:glutathione S-transferase N-terminal domain-containing protein [Usitatibacter sp.]